jgi:ABC-2 type transport system ATP-binding protein
MHRGMLLGLDAPSGIVAAFDRPLLGVHAAERYKALLALRRYEHAHSAYPFGDVLHYTDTRTDLPVERIGADVKRFLDASGFTDASVAPLTPSVEDSFIARTESTPGSRLPDPRRIS